ncbi:Substrate-specific component of queuosine-regulated ECF transporter [Clostridiaceae bacterium JG1575]|nr:Substrate-specific component of queuosine-regulated ECF transporter [Clostridiaceae bacterium JG1575]
MNVRKLTASALFIALNVVLGTLTTALKIPLLFLDTVGTVLGAVLFGPLWGAAIGGLTNGVLGVTSAPRALPFAIVNIIVGFFVGWVAKKWGFGFWTALFTGLALAVLAPFVGTFVAVGFFGGITGDFNDVLFTALRRGGQTVFSSAFYPRILSNLTDKILTCLLVSLLLPTLKKALRE